MRGLEVPDDPRDEAVWHRTQGLEKSKDWEKIVELETQLWTDGPGRQPLASILAFAGGCRVGPGKLQRRAER